MMRALAALLLCLTAAAPAVAITPAQAAKINAQIAVTLCIRTAPSDIPRALAAAGFVDHVSRASGRTVHLMTAPADTATVSVAEGGDAPTCSVSTKYMGAREAVAFTGAVLQKIAPGAFEYGETENVPKVTVDRPGRNHAACTGYVAISNTSATVVKIANAGKRPECVEDGTSQIMIMQ